MRTFWRWLKSLFRNNAKNIDKFSEKLFAKGVDELVKALNKTLPKTKIELFKIIEKNFVAKFSKIPIINDKIEELFIELEVKVNKMKLENMVKEFGELTKVWFNDLYQPESR